MRIAALIVIGLVAVVHAYIAWFEIFAWETRGPKVFTSFPDDLFPQTVTMAANQGVYNAFLSAGLFWALLIKDRKWQRNIAVCFLLFVVVAGIFCGATVTIRAVYIQAIPAVLGLVLLYFSSRISAENQVD
ncbi:DUF1304 domain-containing protein [Sulfitobacter sp. 1151]|uniref:DUF1304 domain-containing protein n=2 Tax=Parasulfitobacter algicola TaxID=2614809 RepID=A0ABX2IUJ1_9RHOB|nr:DUF1304 domain-containing protein [Sulfitobacter algicola]NSX56220.1 DUF1304 domain-containing protein [Sulfitobacter algicola]